MRVVGAILLSLSMLLIAAAVGVAVYFYLDVGLMEAATSAIAALALVALYHTVASRFGMRSVVSRQLADLSRGGADIARQVAELGRRLAAAESRLESALDQPRAITEPLQAQIGDLDARVRRVAETVAAHASNLETLARGAPAARPSTAAHADTSGTGAATSGAAGPPPAPARDVSIDAVRQAIEGDRVDLYLQPIVTLPRRKVRYYEAMSALRSESGESLQGPEFVPHAEASGLMPKLDHLVLFRCVAILRRLLMKSREIGLFCNLSRSSLADPAYAQQLCDFLEANRALAPSLVLQFTHDAVREMGAAEHEWLTTLAGLGFRFSMHELTSLRLEPSELALRRFQYVKVHAGLLLSRGGSGLSDVRAGELSELLGRFGIDLIVDGIDAERSVIELLDRDVRYGQGALFSKPRPVRAEALQLVPDPRDASPRSLAAQPSRSRSSPGASPADNPSTSESMHRAEGAEPGSHAPLPPILLNAANEG